MKVLGWVAVLLLSETTFADGGGAPIPRDPIDSPTWSSMAQRYLSGAPIRFDDRVRVDVPASAEDPMAVPVRVSAKGLKGVKKVLVFADLNPLPKIIEYFPERAQPSLGFSFKVEQSTPIHAAFLTDHGWHVGGAWVSATGGGCTAPSLTTGSGKWYDQLGEVSARLWTRPYGTRLKIKVMHPMDTGLAPGIPVFHIETLLLSDPKGQALARIAPYEPISENPVFTLELNEKGPVTISGRDIQANKISGRIGL